MDKSARIAELVDLLNSYGHAYYVMDDPIVADKVYDGLYDELTMLEKETKIVLPDSPTNKVGGEPVRAFAQHRHIAKLYSLDKCNSYAELRAWGEKIERTVGKVEYALEYKLDGLTACLTYEGGYFKCATTRGNGEIGEDVTAQIKTIKSLPLKINYEGIVEVKGECIMRRSTFAKYNESAAEPLKNPRNGAAGALRNLDPNVTASRNLDLIFYDINYIDSDIHSQAEGVNWLKSNKFRVEKLSTMSDIAAVIHEIEKVDRNSLDFEIDGMVIKISDLTQREQLGVTDKFPKWAIAYKFEALETTTKLLDVIWQVGRSGKLTPLALLEPVELCGATVRRATLNNYGDIERKNIRLGCDVFIRRSNDVIPEILSSAPGEGGLVPRPDLCPACGSKLEIDGAHIFCRNATGCIPQIVARIKHFISKDCMDIDGLSEKTVEQFVMKLDVREPHNLYDLTDEQLFSLDGFKDKKIANYRKGLSDSKRVKLSAFINALGIPNVGKVLATDLAKKYGSIEALATVSAVELSAIDDIGSVIAEGIRSFFDSNFGFVTELLKRGIKPVSDAAGSGVFAGMNFVLTGTLTNYTRAQAVKLIEEHGGAVQPSVTRETNCIVAGENAGSKLAKAQAAGIKVIGENEFAVLLNT